MFVVVLRLILSNVIELEFRRLCNSLSQRRQLLLQIPD